MGGVLPTTTPKTTGANISNYMQLIPQIADSIIDLIDNNPNAYSDEPIVNSSTMKNMKTPYSNNKSFALGGDVDEDQLAQLQELADENGISLEDLIQQLQGNEGDDEQEAESDDESDEGEEYAYGGIHINPKNKGKFNALKKKTGKSTAQLTHSKNPLTRKRAIFAQNAKKWKHAYGGTAKSNIEVEGDEVLQTPNGQIQQMRGPSHEQGGIDVAVPPGTKIFSDRLKIGGKSMQERKLARERKLSRLDKLLTKNPQDQTLKNTVKRTTQNHQQEENRDMTFQRVANKIYQSPKFGMGGKVKYPNGGQVDEYGNPVDDYFDKTGMHYPNLNLDSRTLFADQDLDYIDLPNVGSLNTPAYTGTVSNRPGITPNSITPQYPKTPQDGKLGIGDYIGLAGNAFNTIAPIINTLNNRRATKPNINRFRGFGRKALETNEKTQDFVAGVRSNAITDIDTSANSSYTRNRNSAQSVNTIRALDATTDMAKNKAKNATEDTFAKEMMAILSQKTQLENQKDQVEMSGETSRDLEDKGDTDNFYSNMAANLVNVGTNVQGIGRNLNTAKSNRVNLKLINLLSKYGYGLDEDGNPISTKQ